MALRCLIKLIYSGGHNLLVVAHSLGQYIQLGTTIDDAIGEAYDKSARWLGLDMRKGGGPALEELALEGDPNAVKFRVSLLIVFSCLFYNGDVAKYCYPFIFIMIRLHVVIAYDFYYILSGSNATA